MGAEPGVVVDRVRGEVLGDGLGVAGVQGVVVGADVVEVRDGRILPQDVDLARLVRR
jgi:hypothetical protein